MRGRIDMNKLLIVVPLAISSFFLGSCEENYTDRLKKFEQRIASNRVGAFSSDYWLVKLNVMGEWEKVALVFGFGDNRVACNDYAQLYMQRYTLARVICQAAN
jgi:hypothetical protein